MRKRFAFFLILLAVVVLAACSNETSPSKVDTQATSHKYFAPFQEGVQFLTRSYNYHNTGGHPSIDIVPVGSNWNIVAMREGTVVEAYNTRDNCLPCGSSASLLYGNLVVIKHDDDTYALYAHMQKNSVSVSVGNKVNRGQKIGVMGNTGNSDGAHLHLEVRGPGGSDASQSYSYQRAAIRPSFTEAGGGEMVGDVVYTSQNREIIASNCPSSDQCLNWTPPQGAWDVWVDDGDPVVNGKGFEKATNIAGGMAYWWDEAVTGGSSRATYTFSVSDDTIENYGVWSFYVPSNGLYDAYTYIPNPSFSSDPYPSLAKNLASGVRYLFGPPYGQTGPVHAVIDQNAIRGRWVKVASNLDYKAGTRYAAIVGDAVGGSPNLRRVYYDVIALKKVGEVTPPPPSPSIGNGTGLLGQYWNTTDFSGPRVATSTIAGINVSWGAGSPVAGVNVDGFSARFSGQVQPKYTGEWTFSVEADDGVRLYVNNQLLVDHWVLGGLGTRYSGKITLTAGQKYDIRMEMFEGGGTAAAILLWSHAYQGVEVIPATQLYPTSPVPMPQWSASPANVNMTTGVVGDGARPTQQITLTNSGGVSSNFTVTSSNPAFTVTTPSPFINASSSIQATVTSPTCTVAGSQATTLTISGGGATTIATVNVTRTCNPATPPILPITPTSLAVTMSSNGRIFLSWPQVNNATYYTFGATFNGQTINVTGQAQAKSGSYGSAVATFISQPDAADKQGKQVCFQVRAHNTTGGSGFTSTYCTAYQYYAGNGVQVGNLMAPATLRLSTGQ